ncbi:MAG: Gfo/Idh/MocA family oxidoreductase [Chloroflexi bacterium]|nr:Gfo/Idh/MocA family oxidoreductase [Chloroflexota bacterium]
MLKAAVVGVGSMGRNHARVYREMEGNVQLVGVADANPAEAAKAGARTGVPHFSDYHEMIDKVKPDLVSLAVPTALHAQIGLELIERGINLLIEKPIATTLEEGEALIEAARKAGVVLQVGHIERFNPVVMEMKRRLQEGMAGRIYKIQTQRLSPYPGRIQDAGAVTDLATHDIDLLRNLMNDEISRLYGEILHTINRDREDGLNGILRFRSGIIGVLDVNWITPAKVRRITITGARGMLRCDLLSQELYFYENETAPSQWDTLSVLRGVSEGNVIGFRIGRHEPLAAELADFAETVRTGRKPTVSGEDGLETLRIAREFILSAEQRRVIDYERQPELA